MGGPVRRWDGTRPLKRLTPYYLALNQWVLRRLLEPKQYASEAHTSLLDEHGLIASISRKGNCWDNAVMERFFLNLKMERLWQRDYANHDEAKADIADYIVGFYTRTQAGTAVDSGPRPSDYCIAATVVSAPLPDMSSNLSAAWPVTVFRRPGGHL